MKILAIDTSATACSLALLIDDQVVDRHVIAPMQQTKIILSLINELLVSSHVSLKQLDAIAFGCGPGSFTGVRIATSVAQGLGYAASLPLVPVSSLAALAQSAHNDLGWKKLLVAVDARMHEIYWGIYEADSDGIVQLKGKELLCSLNKVDFPESNDWYGVGNGWEVYKDHFAYLPIGLDVNRLPAASAIARLAKIKYEKGEWVSADKAEPVYLRDNVASHFIPK